MPADPVPDDSSAAPPRFPRVTLVRLEDEWSLQMWEAIVQSNLAGTSEGLPCRASARPRTRRQPPSTDEPKMVWRLIAPNMRPLGVSSRRFFRIDDAHEDARQTILRGDELVPVPVSSQGSRLGWLLELDGVPTIVSDHGYRRSTDRDKAMKSALRALRYDADSILAPLPFDGPHNRWLDTRSAASLRRQLVEESENISPSSLVDRQPGDM